MEGAEKIAWINSPMKRLAFFNSFLLISAGAVGGGYVLQALLLGGYSPSPWYLEVTFGWNLLVLVAFTPIAIRRALDVGISKWWVALLWLPPLFDFKGLFIYSKYTGLAISGEIFWPSVAVALCGTVLLGVLLFSRSKSEQNA